MSIVAYYHVTQAGSGIKNGGSWATAMDRAAFETKLESVGNVAGSIYWVKDGSYGLNGDIDASLRDGNSISPTCIIGVKSGTTNEGANVVYSDWAIDEADRPYFDCGTYEFKVGDHYKFLNIDLQGGDTYVVYLGANCLIKNCKMDNDIFTSASRYGLYAYNGCRIYDNEFISEKAKGILLNDDCIVKYNYFHDLDNATYGTGITADSTCVIEFNIFDNCKTGVYASAKHNICCENNTFYNCGKAVDASSCTSWAATNNILEGCTTSGFTWNSQYDSNFFWNNHGDDARNVDMWVNISTSDLHQDQKVTTGDPKFTTAGSNFSLQNDSPCIGAGMSIGLGVG